MHTQSNLPDVDPRVAALSQKFDALAVGKDEDYNDLLEFRKSIEDLNASELTAFDERCRAALYSAVSQCLAGVQHRREINGGWSPRPEILNS